MQEAPADAGHCGHYIIAAHADDIGYILLPVLFSILPCNRVQPCAADLRDHSAEPMRVGQIEWRAVKAIGVHQDRNKILSIALNVTINNVIYVMGIGMECDKECIGFLIAARGLCINLEQLFHIELAADPAALIAAPVIALLAAALAAAPL